MHGQQNVKITEIISEYVIIVGSVSSLLSVWKLERYVVKHNYVN